MKSRVRTADVGKLRAFAMGTVAETDRGSAFMQEVRDNRMELVALYSGVAKIRRRADRLALRLVDLLEQPKAVVDGETIEMFDELFAVVDCHGSARVRLLTKAVRRELRLVRGLPVAAALARPPAKWERETAERT